MDESRCWIIPIPEINKYSFYCCWYITYETEYNYWSNIL